MLTSQSTGKGAVDRSLKEVEQTLAGRYRTPVFQVSSIYHPGRKIHQLVGKVLTAKQLALVHSSIPKGIEYECEIEVITQSPPAGYATVGRVVDVLEGPNDRLMTQALPVEGPLGVIDYPGVDGHQLVQLPDGAVGWVDSPSLRHNSDLVPVSWKKVTEKKAFPVEKDSLDQMVLSALAYAGTPYRLGGRTKKGIDCSALVQAVLRDGYGLLLPRHSGCQRKVGRRVPWDQLQPGDLYFARQKGSKIMHVGLLWDREQIVHACLAQGWVVKETIEQFKESYTPAGVRRIVDGVE